VCEILHFEIGESEKLRNVGKIKIDNCIYLTQYPSLKDKVQGEESSTFKNVLGDEITVEIFDDVEATAALLEKVRRVSVKVIN
jgi:hypothetical protein